MDRTDNTRRTILLCVLLGAVTLASYWPVLRNGFVTYDDPDYVSENPYVLRGLTWQNAAWAFETAHVANWHPLTWLSHMLDVQLFGLQPAGHHLTSLLLHVANTLLLFLALQAMTRARWRSALVAALFALHPLHVESVAWVAERKDVLSAFFFMLTLLAYARYAEVQSPTSNVQSPRSGARIPHPAALRSSEFNVGCWMFDVRPSSPRFWYWAAVAMFALGLMSKAMLVTLPFVLLLLDYWPLRRFQPAPRKLKPSAGRFHPSSFILHPLLLEKLPFLALAAASSAVTFAAQRTGGAVLSLEAFSPGFRIANTLVSYARYLGKMIWPVRLACFYPAPHEWPLAWVLGAALLLTALTALCVWQAKRAPYLAVGWFWYLGTLVPVIGIVQVGLQSMADRYTYLPLIGLFIAGVWAAADWGSRQSRRKAESRKQEAEIGSQKMFDVRAPESGKDAFHRVPDCTRTEWDAVERVPAWLMGAALVALLLCGYFTWSQTRYWRTTASLFAHALAVTRDNEVAQNNLGTCLFKAGNVAAAEPHFVEALRIRPNLQDALVGLALCRYTEGRVPEAIDCFQRALDMAPTPAGHFNLANVLKDQGRLPEAEAHYQAALRLRPYFVEAWVNLGVVKAEQGDAEAAARAYATALQFRPDCAIAHLYLGQLLMVQHNWDEAIAHLRTGLRAAIPANAHDAPGRKGQTDEAIRQDREALRLKSDYAKARNNLGFALDRKGQTDEAISQYQEAIRLKPDYANARDNLGLALGRKGQTDEAIRQFQEALRLKPEDASAHNNLGTALAKKGQFDEAIRQFQEAVRLKPDYVLAHQNLARALRMKNAPASP